MTSGGIKSPRKWQNEAKLTVLERWKNNVSYRALIAACPGAGKTRCSVEIADEVLRAGSVELVLVLAPTVNIQRQWVDWFAIYSIVATSDANNEALRWRRDRGQTMIEDKAAIVITYQQLARDPDLFAALVERHKTLLIADEVHHADDDASFGLSIGKLVGHIIHSLALSGTPFNTNGGSLALCESKDVVDDETGEVMRQTVATFTYGYGEAIEHRACRQVEFAKVSGHGKVTYRSLIDNTVFEKLVSTSRKSDPIGVMLDPYGEYTHQMIREGLTALTSMREAGDKRAAMLVVARNVSHGNSLIETIQRIKEERVEWGQFSNIQEIYNDSVKAHDRIKALESDNTDIIVSVRMISEGVDIQRLRVGVYCTDIKTRMFFIQFVGRFVRYETRSPLNDMQYAVVVVPAHPLILRWTLEIEKMILSSQIKLAIDGGEGPGDHKNEFIGAETAHDDVSLTLRGEEVDYQTHIIEMMYQKSNLFKNMPRATVIKLAGDLGFAAAAASGGERPHMVNWRDRNNNIVKQIVKLQRTNGGASDDELFARINGTANAHVGIPKMDTMTSEDVLKRRHQFLQDVLRRIVNQMRPDMFT